MSERIDYIPFNKIKSIEIYENVNKLTLSQIVSQKNPDYAITGVFYNTSWKPTCHLKKDGKVLASTADVYRGYRWNSPSDFSMCRVPTESQDYVNHYACCALIVNRSPYPDNLIFYNSDVAGIRGRTAIGIKGNNLVLYASKDGTSDAKTPEKLRDYLYAKGVEELVMGDGGGKVNYYANGYTIQGSAKSQNFILVYLKESENEDTEMATGKEDNGMEIIKKYITNNPRYKANIVKTKIGYVQHSTGTPGAMAQNIINAFNKSSAQAEAHGVIDDTGIYQLLPYNIRAWHVGGSANNTHVGVEVCEPQDTRFLDANWYNLSQNGKNNTTFAVKAVQQELVDRGYNPNGVDGIFGSGTKSAVMAFQKDQGLSQDGIVGKDTLHKLQNREGSHVKYNPKNNQEYFENVYNKAVFYCAYILKEVGVKSVTVDTVLSHAEAYKKGIGSNHADVGHWWPEHGKSMDDFRADVKEYMSTGKLPYGENSTTEVETPANEMDEAWKKAVAKGIFDGSNPDNPCTRKQTATVLDRLGLLD